MEGVRSLHPYQIELQGATEEGNVCGDTTVAHPTIASMNSLFQLFYQSLTIVYELSSFYSKAYTCEYLNE